LGKLGDALRKKYKTPRAALRALGLDEKLLDAAQIAFDGAQTMKKPTRLEFLATTRIARAVNPLLAFDAKVEYGPLTKGLTTANFKERKPKIIAGLKTALKGKTLAGDEGLHMGHVAKMLDHLEGRPEKDSLDESVSGPQHRAMEAAAHGHSNLGIPKNVGEEFEHKDKGKTFGDMIKDWAKDHGLSEDDVKALDKMHTDSMPKSALDGEEETNIEVEEGEDGDIEEEEAEDGEIEEEEAEDEIEEEEGEDHRGASDRKSAKDKAAKDKAAKDRKNAKDRKGAMDKRPITQDELNKALASAQAIERKAARATAEAREFVRPYIGQVSLAMDSAEQILRAAAKAMNIEGAEDVHHSALKSLIKMAGQNRAMAQDASHRFETDLAMDEGGENDSFGKFFPGAAKIGAA
jgi:hypothetical protein